MREARLEAEDLLNQEAHRLGLVTGVTVHTFNRWQWAQADFDIAGNRHHAFGAKPVERRKDGIAAVGDDLGQAIMIAQIDEEEPAMVALAMHPARKPHRLAGIGGAQRGAGMGTVGVHGQGTVIVS